jgi:hypothetical protein
MPTLQVHCATDENAAGIPDGAGKETLKMSSAALTSTLGDFAHARSGDKGNHANIGVIAYSPEDYDHLCQHLTAQRVAEFFASLGLSRVERFELPKLAALNFVLYDCLAGGASRSLRIDTQGKLLGTAILDLPLPPRAT